MPLREILHQWDEAVKVYKAGQYTEALTIYRDIEEISARMFYNMSCVHIKLEQFSEAKECLSSAVEKDTQLAIAFYHRGLLHLKLDRLPEAKADLHATLTLMRGNSVIDYKQLGLLLKLYQTEVLYSIAVTEIKQGDLHAGEDTLHQAIYNTELGQRGLIQEALNNLQNGNNSAIQPLKPSVENVFTPPKDITTNLEKRKYIPKAKVVSAANNTDVNPTFNGERRVQEIRRFSEFSAAIKPPKSPLLLVRKILNKGDKNLTPGMRLNKSTGDLRALAKEFDLSSQGRKSQPLKEPQSADGELPDCSKLTSQSNNHRTSMGSLFGNNLTVVSQVLSSSCDILTAFAVPSVHVTNDLAVNHDASSTPTSQNTSTTNKQDTLKTSVAANQDIARNDLKLDTNCSAASDDVKGDNEHGPFEIKSVDPLKNDNVPKTTQVDTQFSPVKSESRTDLDGAITAHTNVTTSVAAKRQRPPPPSYPPPPLPSTVVARI